jgi:SAM-dependent methyltransferase
MSDWTSGYMADVDYTFGYYPELNPLRVKLAFLGSGLVCPEFGTACELGFGQGLSANLHAAGSVIDWYGTDFNPSQAGFAQELAARSGSGAKMYDESFADFAIRPDLPDFDFIGLHGIWSWISDVNRQVIVDFVRRKLKVGGVLYISYNSLPGWASFAPLRHLMAEHVDVLGAEGHGIVSSVDDSLNFVEKMMATKPLFARANPQLGSRINELKKKNRHYLAHEYFNRDWHPMHFATMVEWLKPAKIQYACSANYLDHIDVLNLTAEQQSFLNGIPDPLFRESVRDFMVNQQFRRDYWVKGVRKLNPFDQTEALRAQKVVLVRYRPDVPIKVKGVLGDSDLSETIYNPILDLLADHKPRTLAFIEQAVKEKGIVFAQVVEAIKILAGAGHLAAAQEEAVIARAKKTTDKFNAYLLDKARGSSDVLYLVSPVTGGGIVAGRFHQLFLLALSHGKKQPVEWAQQVWQLMEAQGQRIKKEGVTVENPAENLAELTSQALIFAEKQLPILKALQIV